MTDFTRTPAGQVAKYLFIGEVLLWVEGPDDIPFYDAALRGSCRIEAAGGKNNFTALVDALVKDDLPYVVVLDGDYAIVKAVRAVHRRLVRLRRYAAENYLCEAAAFDVACRKLARRGPGPLMCTDFDTTINSIGERLRPLMALDLANILSGSGIQVLPKSAETILHPRQSVELDEAAVAARESHAVALIPAGARRNANRLVERFSQRCPVVHLLRGHIVLGILRRLIITTCRLHTGRRPSLDNETLRILLAHEVWSLRPRPRDHRALLRRLRAALRDAAAAQRAQSS